MTDQEIYQTVNKIAKDNGCMGLLTNPTGIEIYCMIFSHEFAKAFWKKREIEQWNLLISDEISGKFFEEILNKKQFIKKYGLKEYNKIRKWKIPYIPGESIEPFLNIDISNLDFIDCFKVKYRSLISYELAEDWRGHLQQMVLEENPLRYLEKFL